MGGLVEWEDFLRRLDTSSAPVLVISDGVHEIGNAVQHVWPGSASAPTPFVLRCEHHLRENAQEALQADGLAHWRSLRMTALNDAFHSPQGWAAFKETIWPKHAASFQWVEDNDAQVLAQINARPSLPAHYSTAALDAHLGTVRDYLDSRSFVLRNQRRTTTMLGLVRLHLNGTDNANRYANALRAWLETRQGHRRPSARATTQAPAVACRRLHASPHHFARSRQWPAAHASPTRLSERPRVRRERE